MKRVLLTITALIICAAIPLWAGPITVDAGWYGFCFGDPGSPASAGCQNDGVGVTGNPTTFTAAVPVYFKITDAFNTGDSFDVNIDSGAIVFTTPSVAAVSGPVTDPDLAFADPAYSHAIVSLSPGPHTVDVFAHDSPFGGGGAYLEVQAVVPEPGTLILLGAGLLATVLLRRRR